MTGSWSAPLASDPFLRPPTDDDRALVAATGGVVDEQIAGAKWFCDAHRLWTLRDCPRCDDELIALLEDEAGAA